MIISNTQMQDVLEHLKFHPDDFVSYLVLGDLLEEDGQIGYAVTMRWLAQNEKSPRPISREDETISCYKWELVDWNDNQNHSLRILVSKNSYLGKRCESFLEAIMYAHKKLKVKRKLFTIPGDVGYE